jgi:NADH-quinone oxidoreductase subunit J
VLTFAISSILFMMIGVEFLSLLIFIVYIGAIAVLFLFVIMMLNIKIVELRSFYLRYVTIGLFIIMFFFFELFFSVYMEFYTFDYKIFYLNWINFIDYKGNIYVLAYVIYSYYCILFILLAIILFIAMFGSIILLINWKSEKKNSYPYDNIFFFENLNKLELKNIYIKKWRYL